MRVLLHSTDKIVELNGVPARIWEGVSEGGVKCHAYITRIACHEDEPNKEEFVHELQECRPPSSVVEAIPLRLLL